MVFTIPNMSNMARYRFRGLLHLARSGWFISLYLDSPLIILPYHIFSWYIWNDCLFSENRPSSQAFSRCDTTTATLAGLFQIL